MSYEEAKKRYEALGVNVEAAMETLKTVPVSLHCWQGDDVRGFDTDPSKPLTGGIQTTGNYLGRARTPEELMADIDQVLADRPETRSLTLATEIYDRKAKIARADMLPTVALGASYLVSNPNMYHGLEHNWRGGTFTVGVMVNIPLFHGFEALQKTRKARAEAALYRDQLDDAREMIQLQVTRNYKLWNEALERLNMAESNLDSAEENLRAATVGYEAGVIDTDTVLGAQTAWLKAHSEYIDAGIELQVTDALIRQSEGDIVPIRE